VQFYIASDAADVIGHAKQQLGEENLIFNSGIATGNAAAVLEAWGLAECDEIIASASSTFSGNLSLKYSLPLISYDSDLIFF